MSEPESTPLAERQQLENELLALRCKRGDRASWDELVARFERPLYFYLRRMLPGEAEALQVLQDTWVRVFSSLPALRDPRRLVPWLYALARRAWLGHVGRRASDRLELVEGDSLFDTEDPAEPGAASAETLRVALGRLPAERRELLTLFFLRDLSLREIADVLEIPVGTVKSRLSKARAELRAVLERMETLE